MVYSGQIIRLFVSSTFSDLEVERDLLQRRVFPALRERCQSRGARFQAIDLRWGVSQEASRDQRTMTICFDEIHRCREVSPEVNFLILLGGRYGSRPLPESIPADEYETLKALMEDIERRTLGDWYKKDLNADPPAYVLLPRAGLATKLKSLIGPSAALLPSERRLRSILTVDWTPDEERLKAILTGALSQDVARLRALLTSLWAPEEERLRILIANILQQADRRRKEARPSSFLDAAWKTVEQHLHTILAGACLRSPLPPGAQMKYLASATHQEIHEGVLRHPGDASHALCALRTITGKPTGPLADTFIESDPDANTRLAILKQEIDERLRGRIMHYEAPWSGDGPVIDDEAFCADMLDLLAPSIEAAIERGQLYRASGLEGWVNERFARERIRHFTGRDTALQAIVAYLRERDLHPLVVSGLSGSGKSTLLAKAVGEARATHSGTEVIACYIGVTPGTSNRRILLESLCRRISHAYGGNEAAIPTDENALMQEFPKQLMLATAHKPLILVIDALDQLGEHIELAAWLPIPLSPHVRLIASILPDSEEFTLLKQRLPAWRVMMLEAMTIDEGEKLLNSWLREAKRKLQVEQREEVIRAFQREGLPLYLRLAFEEARQWHSFTSVRPLKTSISEILLDLFTRLEEDENHGPRLVAHSLAFLCAAKNGLSEDEILEVLSADRSVRDDIRRLSPASPETDPKLPLPVVLWSRLYFDLEPYLTERQANGASLITFYHRQLREVVAVAFLKDRTGKVEYHRGLARYFGNQSQTLNQNVPNLRKLSELPYQETEGAMRDELYATLTDFRFLELKAAVQEGEVHAYTGEGVPLTTSGVYVLQEDFDHAVQQWLTMNREEPITDTAHELASSDLRLQTLVAFQRALSRETYVLAGRSDLLWQQLYNRLKWEEEIDTRPLEVERARRGGPGTAPWLLLRTPLPESPAPIRTIPTGHSQEIMACAFSPNGATILSASDDHSLKLWDARTGRLRAILTGHTNRVWDCAFSQDGTTILSASFDRTLKLWDARTGQELTTIRTGPPDVFFGEVRACAFSPDGATLLSASHDALKLWDARTGKKLATLRGHSDFVKACAFSPDGSTILSAGDDETYRLWDARTGKKLTTNRTSHTSTINDCAFSPDGATILTASDDRTLKLWDRATGQELATLSGHLGRPFGVNACAFSPDGSTILSAGDDATLRLWDAKTGQELATFFGHTDKINACAFSPDGSLIVSAGGPYDYTLKVWNAKEGQKRTLFKGHTDEVKVCAFSPDGSFTVSGGGTYDKTLKLWDAKTGEERVTLRGHTGSIDACAFSPDSSCILSGSWDQRLKMWDVASGRELATLTGHPSGISACAFSPDGATILSADQLYSLMLWNVQGRRKLATLSYHTSGVFGKFSACAFSPDGTAILAASTDHTLKVWDAQTGEELTTLTGHIDLVTACAFSPDGDTILTVSYNNQPHSGKTLTLWSTQTLQERRVLVGHSDSVYACGFSPDGSTILSASRDHTLKVWDVQNGQERVSLPLPGTLFCLAVHPWQPSAFIGDSGGNVYLVDLVGMADGPIIVTGVDYGQGPVVRCPKCGQNILHDTIPMGRVITCPHPECATRLRINPFAITMRSPTLAQSAVTEEAEIRFPAHRHDATPSKRGRRTGRGRL